MSVTGGRFLRLQLTLGKVFAKLSLRGKYIKVVGALRGE